jgi:hypothetical protein
MDGLVCSRLAETNARPFMQAAWINLSTADSYTSTSSNLSVDCHEYPHWRDPSRSRYHEA